ncbi:hypothetical protein PSHT_05567 [Puccinia striiformis]|uniref:Uncharacterized protein n=2 Tax=Puccinia striiformis TaxID=27350 RepID=A0A2S4VK92_9BASI|nr:hypothetical protein PSTT_06453 [Puccinia striiformis]POW18766.1 hypothetical protein PSHT_05567 [Puccinia striiformis]
MRQNINKPMVFPTLLRDPYKIPLNPFPPEFVPTRKITNKRLNVVNFGPKLTTLRSTMAIEARCFEPLHFFLNT